MTLVHTVFLSATGLLLLGCLSSGAAESGRLRTLAKGAFSGIQEPRQQIIKDQAAWEKTWAEHATGGRAPGQLPAVDFAREMVVVVTMGQQRTGGYSVEVTDVRCLDDSLQITVFRRTPPPGSMTIQALTAPFHMVAVPKSTLKPEFVKASAARP